MPGSDDRTVRIDAPAKINLSLTVRGRRPDGYHELDTVMAAIDVCDTVRVRYRPDGNAGPVRVRCSAAVDAQQACQTQTFPGDEDNLVGAVLREFAERNDLRPGTFSASIDKRLPAGSGLGGGSSDAAAALVAAASLVNGRSAIDWRKLHEIVARHGSDLNFFLGGNRSAGDLGRPIRVARCSGRGEAVAPVQYSGPTHFVLIRPPVSLATADVFAALKRSRDGPSRTARPGEVSELTGRTGTRSGSGNDLTRAAAAVSPAVAETLELIRSVAGRDGSLTGSGSACFVATDSADESRRLAGRLRERLPRVDREATWITPAAITSTPRGVEPASL